MEQGTLPAACTVCYYHKDHLGSTAAITKEDGSLILDGRLSYDAWGQRRDPVTGGDTPNLIAPTDRGFTGHEHLEEAALVHMNGRVYDPQLGRFLSADPIVQDIANLQALNRYSYVLNNPLAYTDPSGHLSLKNLFRIGRIVLTAIFAPELLPVAIVMSLPPVERVIAGSAILQSAVAIAGGYAGGIQGAAAAAAYNTQVSGGSLGDIFKSAAIAGGTAAAFSYVGDITGGHGASWGYYSDPRIIGNVAGHAAVGCARAAAQGGDCGMGAATGAAGAFAGPAVSSLGAVGGLVATAAVGGGVEVLGGGKFANGAVTASYGYMFKLSLGTLTDGLRALGECYCGTRIEADPLDGPAYDRRMNRWWRQLDALIDKATTSGPEAYQYRLIAQIDGYYPNLRTGTDAFLSAGDTWKIGTSVDPGHRYTLTFMRGLNLDMKVETTGTLPQVLVMEKMLLIGHVATHLNSPPGNLIAK